MRPSAPNTELPSRLSLTAVVILSILGDPRSYWDHLTYRQVSTSFIKTCAQILQRISPAIAVDSGSDTVALMPVELEGGRIRLAIKNRTSSYARPQINIGRAIESVEVRTRFPCVAIRPEGTKFRVRVPGRGITVVDVVTKAH